MPYGQYIPYYIKMDIEENNDCNSGNIWVSLISLIIAALKLAFIMYSQCV